MMNMGRYSITLAELSQLTAEKGCLVIDIRNADEFEYGHINGAVNIPLAELEERAESLPADKLLVVCCKSGLISDPAAEKLREKGLPAANLAEGYYGWLRVKMAEEVNFAEKAAAVEQSLHTEFRESIYEKFKQAKEKYRLVQAGDHIAVCISGGKDSMLMAKLFGELKKEGTLDFDVTYLVMDPGYSPQNREVIESNARRLGFPIKVFETNIFNSVYNVDKNPCYLCAKMRRGHLYKNAQLAGCNKIALGHHYDDVIETIFMSMIYSGQVRTMMPKLHSQNYEGMQLIRPLYLIREDEIKLWRDHNDLHFIACACRFTDTCTTCNPTGTGSKRVEAKNLIAELKKTTPEVEENIFHSIENVDIDKVISYKIDGREHWFDGVPHK